VKFADESTSTAQCNVPAKRNAMKYYINSISFKISKQKFLNVKFKYCWLYHTYNIINKFFLLILHLDIYCYSSHTLSLPPHPVLFYKTFNLLSIIIHVKGNIIKVWSDITLGRSPCTNRD